MKRLFPVNLVANAFIGILLLRAFGAIASLGVLIAYLHQLPLTELGRFYAMGTVAYVANALIFVPLDFYQQSRFTIWLTARQMPWVAWVRLHAGVLPATLFCTGLVLVLTTKFAPALQLGGWEALLPLWLLALAMYSGLNARNLLVMADQSMAAALVSMVDPLLRLAAAFAAWHILGISAETTLWAAVAGYGLAALLGYVLVFLRTQVVESAVEGLFTRLPSFSLAIAIGGGGNLVQVQAYRPLGVEAGSAEAVGGFSALANIGSFGMNAIGTAYSQWRLPRLFRDRGGSLPTYLAGLGMLVGFVAAVGLLAVHPLLHLIGKSTLAPWSMAILAGVLSEGCNLALGAIASSLAARGVSAWPMAAAGMTGAVIWLVTWLAASAFLGVGLATIALSMVISQAGALACAWVLTRPRLMTGSALP